MASFTTHLRYPRSIPKPRDGPNPAADFPEMRDGSLDQTHHLTSRSQRTQAQYLNHPSHPHSASYTPQQPSPDGDRSVGQDAGGAFHRSRDWQGYGGQYGWGDQGGGGWYDTAAAWQAWQAWSQNSAAASSREGGSAFDGGYGYGYGHGYGHGNGHEYSTYNNHGYGHDYSNYNNRGYGYGYGYENGHGYGYGQGQWYAPNQQQQYAVDWDQHRAPLQQYWLTHHPATSSNAPHAREQQSRAGYRGNASHANAKTKTENPLASRYNLRPRSSPTPPPSKNQAHTRNVSTHAQRRQNSPRLHLMERPSPSPLYMAEASKQPQSTSTPRKLLIILDLNGTLLKRLKFNGSNDFIPRPHLHKFLHYIFAHHRVMVWSSAKPRNVQTLCNTLFTAEQQQQLAGIWARDKLRLTPQAYVAKSQVYKQLSWVWEDAKIQASSSDGGEKWSQANTVLIDDSTEKAASEPYNLVEIEEFEAREDQMQEDVLGQVIQYLETLRWQADVSAYMRSVPFKA